MTGLFTHFGADSTAGIGALGIDGKALLIQLVTFLLAYLVLRKWAFGPILKVMQNRRELIDKGVSLGEQMAKEKAQLEKQVAKALGDARAKADAIVSDAQAAAREAARDAEDKAGAKAKTIIEEGKARAQQEVGRARKALEKELVGLVSDATEAIVHEKVDAKKDAALIDRALKERQAA